MSNIFVEEHDWSRNYMKYRLNSFMHRNKSLIILCVIVLIPIAILSYFLLYENYQSRHEQETTKNLQIAQLLAQNLDSYISDTKASLLEIATIDAVKQGDKTEVQHIFSNLHLAQNEVSLFWLVDASGHLLAEYPNQDHSQISYSAVDKEFFQQAMKGNAYVSDRITGEITNREIVVVSVPYRNNQGQIAGVIGASIPLEDLQRKLELKVGSSGYAILISKSGKFLAHPKLNDIRQKVKNDDPIWRAIRAGGSGTLDIVAPYDGVRKFFSYVPMAEADWVVIVIQPLNEFEAQLQQLITRNSFIIILLFMLIVLAARYLVLTRNREEEARVLRSEKLAVVGELAAGMAHEIRNPLTAISGFIQMIMKREDGKAPREYLDTVMSEIGQIQSILEETLVLARPAPIQITKVDVSQVIKDVMTLMQPTASMHNCYLSLNCQVESPTLQAEPNRLKQAFVNLIKNSIESMPETGGQIFIEISLSGNKLLISIKDSGCGIPKDMIEKLGNPFLTTKEKGTGLGLTVTFRIIQNHGGTIRVESSQGVGTSIFISLPLTQPKLFAFEKR
jgi:signal transduction histidine kinase